MPGPREPQGGGRPRPPESYAASGVDIDRGEAVPRLLRSMSSRAVSQEIGGFAGGVPIDLTGYRKPRLLSTTDGVGSKILLCRELRDYSTIGIDLVAMCVNDLAVCGCTPALFLDYLACHRVDESVISEILRGIADGCEEADCTLAGGETAELPDIYAPGEIDLAGFAAGVVDDGRQLPRRNRIVPGSPVFGLPSVGIHSNGLTLARKVIPESETELRKELLRPTKIYVRPLAELIRAGEVLAAAHITGGGLEGNLRRVVPDGLGVSLTWDWPIPSIFDEIQERGSIDLNEMRRVFNMGIGIALILSAEQEDALLRLGEERQIEILRIGSVTER